MTPARVTKTTAPMLNTPARARCGTKSKKGHARAGQPAVGTQSSYARAGQPAHDIQSDDARAGLLP